MSEKIILREVGDARRLAEHRRDHADPDQARLARGRIRRRGARDRGRSFVPPKLLPQLADAEAVVRHALTLPGLIVSALIPNLRGAERGSRWACTR